MNSDGQGSSRKEFLVQLAVMAGAPVGPAEEARQATRPKILIVVAHPDDEYAFAATVYRITKDFGGTVDRVVLTNGEGGYRYAGPAVDYYGLELTQEEVGRAHLPAIRMQETLRAGRILGIRNHHFLNQKDGGFTLNGRDALAGMWDIDATLDRIMKLCRKERYEYIFGLLPTSATHGHHQAATLLAVKAVSKLPAEIRPVLLASEPSSATPLPVFHARAEFPVLRLAADAPVYEVSRLDSFGPGGTLNYNIVVNWVIAEHKSQGLFQAECGRHSQENFWVFETGTIDALRQAGALFGAFRSTLSSSSNS